MSKILIITGQTATGKTNLAIERALKENGELINCDSRQIYKKLDIITGKDITDHNFHIHKTVNGFAIGFYELRTTNNELIKVWLYDIVDPKQYFSSFDYQNLAIDVIRDVLQRGKTPIIVGGTYFYLYHLLYSVGTENILPNWELRKVLNDKPVAELQNKLSEINLKLFDSLNESDRRNPQRLIRKIEISKSVILSETKWSRRISRECEVPKQVRRFLDYARNDKITLNEKLESSEKIELEYLGLRFKDKKSLHEKIRLRTESRLEAGAVKEVENLLAQGYTENDPGLKTIGYQSIIKCLEGKITKEQAIEEWQIREHQYAKRQYTFMKRDANILWIEL